MLRNRTTGLHSSFNQNTGFMSNRQDFEKKIAVIMEIADNQVKVPYIPIDIFIQEAEFTHYWAEEDKEELTRVGLAAGIIEDIPARAGACREAQSRWNKTYNKRRDAEKEWKKKAPEAYDMRNSLLHDFRFAYRDDAHLRNRVSAVGKKQGHSDMIQDLNDLAVLGKSNPAPLYAIGFKMALLDEASQISDEMATLLAQVYGERTSASKSKKIRDKAYTHLKEAVDTVRQYGKFVFWRDPTRLKKYCSAYIRKRRRNQAKSRKSGPTKDSKESM